MQEDHGWIGSHSTASTPHHLDQTPTGTYTTEDWIRKLPREFLDINEGSLKDVMLVIRRCFEEAELLPANHQEAAMREQGERFKLWMDGEDDLDLRLVRAPTVREEFVSNLTTLVLFLSTGSTSLYAEKGSAANV